MLGIKTNLLCEECGEPLQITSRKAVINNIDEMQELKISVQPCDCTSCTTCPKCNRVVRNSALFDDGGCIDCLPF